MKTRVVALVVTMAMLATACGGRLSDEQISAERAADAAAAGRSAGIGGAAIGPLAAGGNTLSPSVRLPTGGVTGSDLGGNVGDTGGGTTTGPIGSGSGTGTGSGNGNGGGGGGGGDLAADPYAFAGDNGGATDVGITATEVVIGNVSTLSGPVPGLFRGALVGTQAYLERENARGGYFGRRFRVESGDDGFDAGKNRAAHKALKDKVFAFVGSFSTADSAGAGEMESSGVLDIGRPLAEERYNVSTHIGPIPLEKGWGSTAGVFFKERFPTLDTKKVAFMWAAVEAARVNAAWFQRALESEGYEIIYSREVQATESNFAADVVEMNRQGVEMVIYLGDVTAQARIWKAMYDQNYEPKVKYSVATAYDSSFLTLVGDPAAAENTIVSLNVVAYLGEDAGIVPEVAEFVAWMDRIDPNQPKDLFAFYGWISAKLLVKGMHMAGPAPTRTSVFAAIESIGNYDSDGMTETVNIGARTYPKSCELFLTVKSGKFQRFAPTGPGYYCAGRFVPEA